MMRKLIIVLGLLLFVTVLKTHGQEKRFYDAPAVGIKTNVLYWMTTTLNIGAEIGLGKKTTLDIQGAYNPWDFKDNQKIKLRMGQVEFRYWTGERFIGHFFGLHAHYGDFNMGGFQMLGMDKYRYEGSLYGGGISYGYQWVLGKRLNLEATIGLGYARIEYDKLEYQAGGDFIKKDTRNYFGPTKAGLSLVYIIR